MVDFEKLKKLPLGEIVKTIREERGFNQTSFGQMIGLDQASVSRVERGERWLDSEELGRFTTVFPEVKVALPLPADVFKIMASGPGFSFEITVNSRETLAKKLKMLLSLIEDS
ncbi:MAG: helix-turn-helix transcriptional regulator [Patescibacteria group bacterium]|jgi:transcriptional regulator with XRE-family HTH domain